MNTLFNIQPDNIDTTHSRLFLIIGLRGISYTVLTRDNIFNCVGLYNYDAGTSFKKIARAVDKIIAAQPLLSKQFKSTIIIYSFTNSVLVPYELLNDNINSEMLQLIYGNAQEEVVKKDFLHLQNLYNIYRIPSDVDSLMAGRFPSATFIHLHSLLPNAFKDAINNHVYSIFGSNSITVLLKKENKIQAIQVFEYKTPEDVAYYLLTICNSFDASIEETTLHISGLIDKVSTLYMELYKFFRHIEFDALPDGYTYSDNIKEYSPHFFSHLFAVASCV